MLKPDLHNRGLRLSEIAQVRYGLLAIVFVLLFAGLNGVAHADQMQFGEAINKAGRQRMLTQRIVLAYCQAGLGVTSEESVRRLHAAVQLFDTQLSELKRGLDDHTVQRALAQVEAIWTPLRKIALAPVSRERVKELLFWHDDLLHASHKVVLLLQDQSGTGEARLVNISGRQRMLSQRLAKFYMLIEWGFESLTITQQLAAARREFDLALKQLRAARQNTPAIQKELDDVALHWTWFEMALTLQKDDAYRLVVADSSEFILNAMDRITRMYEQLSRS